MKTVTLEYTSVKQLKEFVLENNISSYNQNLIQIFTSLNDKLYITNLINNILEFIPNAKIIGATTCGEISNNGALRNSTVISFSKFDKTKIETKLVNANEDSFKAGRHIIKSFEDYNSNSLKLFITFSDGLNTNGEEYLAGISSVNNDVVVSGGMAGDNAMFEETFVFTQSDITNNGSVAAALYNENLSIYTDYSFNWETVGKKHIVEKSAKNRVYRISGMTTVDFYKYYLGDDMGRLLPSIGIEFPLILKKNNVNIGRAVLAKHDDGSLSFAGNIPQGSEIQFGHGDVQMIINKGLNSVKHILDQPVESIFIYSCMGRHALLQEDINLELLPLRELAPISGFFTYGEFYHSCNSKVTSNQLLNETMVIVAISENIDMIDEVSPNIFSHNPPSVNDVALHRTQALSILIERTTKELEDLNNQLEQRVKKEVAKNLEKDDMMQVMQSQAQLGDMIEMIIHQWRQPLSGISTVTTSLQLSQEIGTLDDEVLSDMLNRTLSYVNHLNITVDDFRDLFRGETELTPISLGNLINKSLTIINPLIKKESIEVIKDIESDVEILVPISLMMQVMLNIIKNAIDVIIEKDIKDPKIKFKTYIKKNRCVIKIMDNGGGIPYDILPYIFDRKFTTKGAFHGTGIGLNMSKIIIESKVGGKLTANNVGNWAVFNMKIPLFDS